MKKLNYEQLDNTYIYLYASFCTGGSNSFTKLADAFRKNHVYVKIIKIFESESQMQQYIDKDIGRFIFWEQNVNNAIRIIEDSILHDNASEDAVYGYQNFRNQIFVR